MPVNAHRPPGDAAPHENPYGPTPEFGACLAAGIAHSLRAGAVAWRPFGPGCAATTPGGRRPRTEFSRTIPLFNAWRYPMLPAVQQLAISRQLLDLTDHIRRRRNQYTAASSPEDFEWALRQAINAEQDEAELRLVPATFMRLVEQMAMDSAMRSTDDRLTAALEVREAAMAENLAWVLGREGPRGRLVYFAHTNHQARSARVVPGRVGSAMANLENPSGRYLRSMLGAELFTVGAAYGTADFPGQPWVTQPADGLSMEALLGQAGLPRYLLDLRTLPASGNLRDWFAREQPMRGNIVPMRLALPRAYDAILYLDRITPVGAPR